MIQKVTPDIAESLGLDRRQGRAGRRRREGRSGRGAPGLKQGDVIVEFNGSPINDSSELPLLVARTPIGKAVTLTVIRDKQRQNVSVTIAELKDEEELAQGPGDSTEDLGLAVQTLTPELAENLGVERGVKGVVVTQVDPDGPAGEAGLRRGDVILEVNRVPVKDAAAYTKAVQAIGKGKSVLFLVRRGDNTIFLAVKPSSGE